MKMCNETYTNKVKQPGFLVNTKHDFFCRQFVALAGDIRYSLIFMRFWIYKSHQLVSQHQARAVFSP